MSAKAVRFVALAIMKNSEVNKCATLLPPKPNGNPVTYRSGWSKPTIETSTVFEKFGPNRLLLAGGARG
ncbi:MAG: hypothetical protein HRU31_15880 [Rhodobacteraceae bacterium]|nr:hypothetical protein [Paracoccaceae bacterium]